jgi:GNAT superfamily N-acetyltransferase
MSTSRPIKVGLLKESELEEAGRIVRLAFGTFLGLPDPLDFMRDRNLMTPRWRSTHVKVIAAREGGRLIGSNVVTRWGSFGFFGPLTVLPEYWDRGVAQRLLESTMTIFDQWGVRHTGLFTFPQSAKHVGLYQKFGYWPRYLTAIMTRTLKADSALQANPANAPALLSAFTKSQCQEGKVEHGVKKRHSGGISPAKSRSSQAHCPTLPGILQAALAARPAHVLRLRPVVARRRRPTGEATDRAQANAKAASATAAIFTDLVRAARRADRHRILPAGVRSGSRKRRRQAEAPAYTARAGSRFGNPRYSPYEARIVTDHYSGASDPR